MSFKAKMLSFILLPAVVAVALISVYAYQTAKTSLEEQIEQANAFAVESFSRRISETLLMQEGVVKGAASLLADRDLDEEALLQLTTSLKNADPERIMNVIIAFEDGSYRDSDRFVPSADFDVRKRDWYRQVMQGDGPVYTEVYRSARDNTLLNNLGVPIVRNGRKIGVVAVDVNLQKLLDQTKEMKMAPSTYLFLLSREGTFIFHPEFVNGENIREVQNGRFAGLFDRLMQRDKVVARQEVDGVEHYYSSAPLADTGWILVASTDADELFGAVGHMAGALAGACVLLIILLAAAILRITLPATRALHIMVASIQSLAEGDFRHKERLVHRSDEFGKMADALVNMRGRVRALITGINDSAQQLAASGQELTASADQSAQVANQIAASITNVARSAADQFAAVDATNQAIAATGTLSDRLGASAAEVGESVSDAAERAAKGNLEIEQAIVQMNNIELTVGESAKTVTELGDRSKEIGTIVDAISGIAGQTNLLALNAAIEAARAGEQGKGFAVVAEEVRKLAEQSQEAAQEISQLIAQIQRKTESAVVAMQSGSEEVTAGARLVNHAGQSFQEINAKIARITEQMYAAQDAIAALNENTAQTEENARQIDALSKNVSDEAQTVSAATEEAAASMEEMSTASQALAMLAQKLQTEVGKFQI